MDTSDAGVMFNMGGSAGYPAGYTQDQVDGKLFSYLTIHKILYILFLLGKRSWLTQNIIFSCRC